MLIRIEYHIDTSHEISNYSETYNVPIIEKINEPEPKRQVHFFPQPSRGPFEALPLAQQGAEWALLGAHFGPFCAQCGLAQKGPEWSRGPKRTGPQSGSPSWPQLPTQLGPIRGPHGNAARAELSPIYARELSKGHSASPDWLYGGDLVDATKKCEAAKKIGDKIIKCKPQDQGRLPQKKF